GDAMVPGSVSRERVRAAARHDALFVERAWRRTADFHSLLDATAGVLALLLLRRARDHALRLRLSGEQHAAHAAIGHVSRSVAVLSDRTSWNFSERRRTRGTMAADDRDDASRDRHAHSRDSEISQVARL